jgi:predicted RND superfamily exporter protein
MTILLSRIYDQFVLGLPRATLLVLFAIAVFFSYHAQNFQLDASADSLLLEDDTDLELFRSVRGRYPSQEFLIVTFSPNTELFSEQSLTQLGQLRDTIRQIKHVDSVVSILDVPLLKSSNVPLVEIAENIQTLEKPGIDLEKAKQELKNSPIYSNSLISRQADTTGLLINLKDNSEFISIRDTRNT